MIPARIMRIERALAVPTFLFILPALLAVPADFKEEGRERGFALLVGCTEYRGLRRTLGEKLYKEKCLHGPANDVELISRILNEKLGFSKDRIAVLSGWPEEEKNRPTMENILSHLSRLAEEVKEGDRVVILLCGHGTQLPDRDGDELDGLDEVFLPADVTCLRSRDDPIPNALTDDTLGRWIKAMAAKKAFVWIIVDSCHSGTIVRGGEAGVQFRYIKPELLGIARAKGSRDPGEVFGKRRDQGPCLDTDIPGNYAAFYAAQSFHKAPEMPLPQGNKNAKCHGLLTYLIAEQLARYGGHLTFRELLAHLVSTYQTIWEGTIPFAEGNLNRRIATPGSDSGESLFLFKKGDELILNAGELIGVERGTLLDVYPPGNPGAPPLGRVEVVDAKFVESTCKILGDNNWISPGDPSQPSSFPVQVAQRIIGEYNLKIAAVDAAGKSLPFESLSKSVRSSFEQYPKKFPLVRNPEDADWLLVVEEERLGLRPVKAGSCSDPFVVPPGDLLEELAKVFRSRNLRRLAGSGRINDLPAGLEFKVLKVRENGDSSAVQPGGTFRPGESFRIEIQNRTGRIHDVTVLYIDAHNGISVLFPCGQTARLTHLDRGVVKIPDAGAHKINDQQLGIEHLLVIAIPREEASEVIDLSWLKQPPQRPRLRGEEGLERSGNFGRVLRELAFGLTMHRGLSIGGDDFVPAMRLITWRTEWPEPAPPPWPRGGFIELPQAKEDLAAGSGSAIPDPWRIGPCVALERSGSNGEGYDLLLGGGEKGPAQVLLDVDGDSPGASQEKDSLARFVAARGFEAEAAFHFFPGWKIAFYDTENDGSFDLILVDEDPDPEADVRHSRQGEKWKTDRDINVPWMSTAYLKFLKESGAIDKAVKKFAVLAKDGGE